MLWQKVNRKIFRAVLRLRRKNEIYEKLCDHTVRKNQRKKVVEKTRDNRRKIYDFAEINVNEKNFWRLQMKKSTLLGLMMMLIMLMITGIGGDVVYAGTVPFVTEWTVPENVNGTTVNPSGDTVELGTTITLPIPTNSSNSYTVNWGDGTTETFTTEDFPTHTYVPGGQTYTVSITGTVKEFGLSEAYNEELKPEENAAAYPKHQTFVNYLTKITAWGEIDVETIGFANCANLAGSIPAPSANSFTNVTVMNYTFYNCTKLTGSIPETFFASATSLNEIKNVFENCTLLTGTIPENIFVNNTDLYGLDSVFKNCIALSGTIPANIFASNLKLGTASHVFEGCKGLSGNIPSTIFEKNTNLERIHYIFRDCSRLTGTIPENLFANNLELYNINGAFEGCTGLTGNIPTNLLVKNTKLVYASSLFKNCTGITGTIPESLFVTNTLLDDLSYVFYNCSLLTGTIPENLFATNKKLSDLSYVFSYCSKLTGSIPTGIFTYNTELDEVNGAFMGCTGLTGNIPETLLSTNTKLIDVSKLFDSCRGLDGTIPEMLFANNKLIEDFEATFKDCINIDGPIPTNLFAENTAAKSMSSVFSGCTSLDGEIPASLFAKNTLLENLRYAFYSCSALTGSIPENLLTYNTALKNIEYLFGACTGLKGSIPADLLKTNILLTNVAGLFEDCTGLTGSIPATLFTNNVLIEDFSNIFNSCTGLTGSIPATLFATNTEATSFRGSFYSCTGLTGKVDGALFANCKKIEDLGYVFADCTFSIEELQVDTTYLQYASDMIAYNSDLMVLTLGKDFKKLDGENMFGSSNIEAIFLHCNPLNVSEVPVLGDLDYIGLPSKTIIYVPTDESEYVYEKAWRGIISPDRVRPILDLIGNRIVDLEPGETYVDEGYDLLTFDLTAKPQYENNVYGVNVTTGGALDEHGSHIISYTLTRELDGNSTEIAIANRYVTYVRPEEYIITEWTIPVNADGDGGTKIILPISAQQGQSYVVHWGDGIVEMFDGTDALPFHVFENTEETKYTVKVRGTVEEFAYNKDVEPTKTNSYSDYYTFTHYVTGFKQWGETNTKVYAFANCVNLKGTIPIPTENSFKELDFARHLFYNCTNLTGSIPSNLFRNATKLESLNWAFTHCAGLTGSIPSDLLTDCVNLHGLRGTFKDCTNLSGTIPATLFEKNTEIDDVAYLFNNCASLTGSIPGGLFSNNPNSYVFKSAFKECTSLTGEIPAELFSYTTAISTDVPSNLDEDETFEEVFEYSTGLTSVNLNIPYIGYQMFNGCNGLTDITIGNKVKAIATEAFFATEPYSPDNLLETTLRTTNSVAINYEWETDNRSVEEIVDPAVFITEWTIPGNSVGTTVVLPAQVDGAGSYTVDWGDGSNNTYSSSDSFPTHTYTNTEEKVYTMRITGSLTTFGNISTDESVAEGSNYNSFTEYLTGLKQWGELGASSYGFANCKNLSGTIPTPTENTFINVTTANALFYNCSNLTGNIPGTLFRNANNIQTFDNTFANCTKLTGEISGTLFENSTSATSFNSTFAYCEGLSGNVSIGLFEDNTGVTSAEGFAKTFYGCSNIERLEINTQFIGQEMFYANNKLTNITIGNNLTSIGTDAFQATSPYNQVNVLYTVLESENTVATSYDWAGDYRKIIEEGTVIEPAEFIMEYEVPQDSNGTGLGTTAIVPITVDADMAYSVDWGDGNVEIYTGTTNPSHTYMSAGNYDIKIAGKVKTIGNYATDYPAANTAELTFIQLFNGLKQWGTIEAEQYGFSYCSNLTTIPEFSENTFANTRSMKAIFANTGITTIPEGIFDNCPNVTDFSYAFSYCDALTGTIPEDMFAECENIQNVERLFLHSSGLTGSILADFFPSIVNDLNTIETFAYTGISSVEIDITNIQNNMFYGCNKLKTIVIGDAVVSIGTDAFQAVEPYSETNLLLTKLTTTNEAALTYDWTGDYRSLGDDSAFVTVWKIPVDVDGTAGEGTTITLPIPSSSYNNYTVNWGNGIIETFDSTANFPTYTYTNTAETEYTITIKGIVDSFGYNSDEAVAEDSEYYTFTQYLIGLEQWGELGANYGFAQCKNLSSGIPEPTENTFVNMEYNDYLFYGCENLTGEIPENLFASATSLESLGGIFSGCYSLEGSIPENLFANNKLLSEAWSVFYDTSLSGGIPENLFMNNPELNNVESCFAYSAELTSIPENLFKNNPKLKYISSLFSGCSGLTCEIPEGLFANNNKIKYADYLFEDCSGLRGEIPADLFKGVTALYDLHNAFTNCSSLTGSIPAGFLDDNDLLTDVDELFSGCSSLDGTIPAGLFANKPDLYDVENVFYKCTSLSGSIPSDLFENCPSITKARNLFYYCSNLEGTIPEELFADSTGITSAYYMFYRCSGLTGIFPNGLFATHPGITSFDHTFSYCSGLTGKVTAELFENNTQIETLELDAMFKNCSSLTSIEIDVPNIGAEMFEDCLSATTIKIGDNVVSIPAEAFIAEDPYSSSNLLSTTLITTNEVAINHTWETTENRKIEEILESDAPTSLRDLSITLDQVEYTYDGAEKKPVITIVDADIPLTNETDYTLEYSNNVNSGIGKIKIYGKGEYTGTIIKYFTILKAKVVKPTTDTSVSYAYNGNTQTLKLNDFDETKMTILNNKEIDAGAYVAQIMLKNNNYEWADGTSENLLINWTIEKMPISINWTNTELIYNGLLQKPTTTVSAGVTGETIEVSVSGEAVNAGDYSATAEIEIVTGGRGKVGNYKLVKQ